MKGWGCRREDEGERVKERGLRRESERLGERGMRWKKKGGGGCEMKGWMVRARYKRVERVTRIDGVEIEEWVGKRGKEGESQVEKRTYRVYQKTFQCCYIQI